MCLFLINIMISEKQRNVSESIIINGHKNIQRDAEMIGFMKKMSVC